MITEAKFRAIHPDEIVNVLMNLYNNLLTDRNRTKPIQFPPEFSTTWAKRELSKEITHITPPLFLNTLMYKKITIQLATGSTTSRLITANSSPYMKKLHTHVYNDDYFMVGPKPLHKYMPPEIYQQFVVPATIKIKNKATYIFLLPSQAGDRRGNIWEEFFQKFADNVSLAVDFF